jgi:hypothetical protein
MFKLGGIFVLPFFSSILASNNNNNKSLSIVTRELKSTSGKRITFMSHHRFCCCELLDVVQFDE